MDSTVIAVDLAKEVFEVAVSERPGRVAERHRLSRVRFGRFLAQHATGTVVMEACGTAHFWARQAQANGCSATITSFAFDALPFAALPFLCPEAR